MIRAGIESDLPAIIDMARRFWANTIYDEDYCGDTVSAMAEMCMSHGLMAVLDVDGVARGFACGVKGPLLANADVLTGAEVAWWVDPEHRAGRNGIALMKYLERLAKEAGIKYWNMSFMFSSMPEAVERIYQSLGYKKTETTYMKVI